MKIKSSNEHIQNLCVIMSENKINGLDAIQDYSDKHGYDPYFIADIVKSNRAFYLMLQKEARELKIIR